MRSFIILILLTNILFAKLTIAVSYDYIKDIVQNVAKENVDVIVLANPKIDPHFVIAKPSLIAKLRGADVLIINGAQLEIGWIPALIKSANNNRIFKDGHFLELSNYVNLIGQDDHEKVSRAMGDVHPDGNPHFLLDPYNVPLMIDVVTAMLVDLDPQRSSSYETNAIAYKKRFNQKILDWNKKMVNPKFTNVIEYHHLYDYFLNRYNIKVVETLEPIPGVTPTAKHLVKLLGLIKKDKANVILQSVYNSTKEAKFLSSKVNIPMIILPHDVNSVQGSTNIIEIFDYIVKNMSE
jgi:zinc/manganese transport system substrate-binding protein